MRNSPMIFLILTCFFATAQHNEFFEGVLTYKLSNMSFGKPDLSLGTEKKVYFKKGHMKNTYNTTENGSLEYEIYNPNTGLLHFKLVGIDTIFWYDVSIPQSGQEIIYEGKGQKTDTVLEKECNSFKIETNQKFRDGFELEITKYFYFSEGFLEINKKWFSKYNFDYYSHYLNYAGVLCMKYKTVTRATVAIGELITVDSRILEQDVFNLKIGLPQKRFNIN